VPLKADTKIALAVAGAGFGTALAFPVFYSISRPVIGDWLTLLVCPPCLGLMALHDPNWKTTTAVFLSIAAINSFFYLLAAGLLRALFGWFKSKKPA
jgi:hypothetical protein